MLPLLLEVTFSIKSGVLTLFSDEEEFDVLEQNDHLEVHEELEHVASEKSKNDKVDFINSLTTTCVFRTWIHLCYICALSSLILVLPKKFFTTYGSS